jgi:hypothetical protein
MIRKIAIPVLALLLSVNAKDNYGEPGEQKWYKKEIQRIQKNADFIADKHFISTLTIPEQI